MSIDQNLPEALRRTADEHFAPFPDLSSIVAGGRRRKRRRDVRRLSFAAACLAVVAAVPLVVRPFATDSPAPTGEVDRVARVTDLPEGATPAIPYCPGDRTIRGAGDPVDAECDVLIHRGETTLFINRHGVNQLADGQLTLLDSRDWSSWFPALSLDGRWAAWVTPTPHGVDDGLLLTFDLRTGARTEVPWETADGWVAGIDDLGRVYFEAYESGRIKVFDPRSGTSYAVTGIPDHSPPSIKFVTADGLGILNGDGEVVAGTVEVPGRFTQQHSVEQAWGTSFSPDRSHQVYEHDGRLVVGQTSGDRAAVPLQLPSHGEPVWFPVWETAESVLVQFDPLAEPINFVHSNGLDSPARRTWLLRCRVSDGSCEVALPAGWGDRMSGPVYR